MNKVKKTVLPAAGVTFFCDAGDRKRPIFKAWPKL